ncbi:hypothetical protein H4R19_004009, partial [Coemansia spiralis]
MDFSRPRMRLGGAQMVKTYGRFKQRIVHREAMGAQEFARVTAASAALADILGQSSDSDFEDAPPSKAGNASADSCAQARPAKDNAKPARSRRNTASTAAAPLGGDVQHTEPPHSHPAAPARRAQREPESNTPAEPVAKARSRVARREGSTTRKTPAAPAHDTAGELPKRRSRARSSSADRAARPTSQDRQEDARAPPVDSTTAATEPQEATAAPAAACEQAPPETTQPECAPSPISGGNVTRRRTDRRNRSTLPRDLCLSSPAVKEPALGGADAAVPCRNEDILARRLSHVLVRDTDPEPSRALAQGERTTEPVAEDCMHAGTACSDDSEESARQHLAARAMRFKAPHNARVQTFELDSDGDVDGDDNDGKPVCSTPTRRSRLSTTGPLLADGDGEPQPEQGPSTPQRPTQ